MTGCRRHGSYRVGCDECVDVYVTEIRQLERCSCSRLGSFWRVRYPDRPGVTFHVACGRLRELDRHSRPLVAR